MNAELPVSVEVTSGVTEEGEAEVREKVWAVDLRGRKFLGAVLTHTPEEVREHAARLLEGARKAEEMAEGFARRSGKRP